MAYNAEKAAQVIAYLASKTLHRRISVLKVIKLVYLADRESIQRFGFPILEEDRYSMPHGPVNSLTYGHINGEYDLDACGWSRYLRDRANHEVSVRKDAPSDLDELSEADIDCLDAVWQRFGHMDQWQLRDWTHVETNVPEWQDPQGRSVLIPLARIMEAVGIPSAEAFAETAQSFAEVERVFQEIRG